MTRYSWWGYVKSMVRKYPERSRRIAEMKMPGSSSSGGGRSPGRISRPTEEAALRQLPGVEQREYEAVRDAIKTVSLWKNGEALLKMIKYMYWEKSKNLYGAAAAVGYTYDHAQRLHGQFIREVAKKFEIL